MAKRYKPIKEVLAYMERDAVTFEGACSDKYATSVKTSAIHYLEQYQLKMDEQEVVNLDVAEVGAIIRRQRERIAFLENEMKVWERDYKRVSRDLCEAQRELRHLGAL